MIDGTNTSNKTYAGSFVYNDSGLEYALFEEGRLIDNSGTFEYQYFLKDHLGNTRVTFSANDGLIKQQDHYYPFGMSFSGITNAQAANIANQYKYNGKELQDNFGLNWYDYGARFYDAQIARWHLIDNKAEKYSSFTPYVYSINNPIRFIDPDGNEIVDATGKQITYDAKNGWSKNATNDVKAIYSALKETKTGREQWNKAYNSSSKIAMNIVESKLYSDEGLPSLGQVNNPMVQDLKTGTAELADDVMTINISLGNINESFDGVNKGLTLRQAIASTAGHEIEHTTKENRNMGVVNVSFPDLYSNDEKERKPREIGSKIRKESLENNLQRAKPIIKNVVNVNGHDPSQGYLLLNR